MDGRTKLGWEEMDNNIDFGWDGIQKQPPTPLIGTYVGCWAGTEYYIRYIRHLGSGGSEL